MFRRRGMGQSAYDTANPPLVITGDQINQVTMADLASRHVIWNGQYINNYTPLQLAQAQALQNAGVYNPTNATSASFMYGSTPGGNTIQDIKNAVASSMGAPTATAPSLFTIAPQSGAPAAPPAWAQTATPIQQAVAVPAPAAGAFSPSGIWSDITSGSPGLMGWLAIAGGAGLLALLFLGGKR